MLTTKKDPLICNICSGPMQAVQYDADGDGSLRTTKHVVLACPQCDAVNAWPRAQRTAQ